MRSDRLFAVACRRGSLVRLMLLLVVTAGVPLRSLPAAEPAEPRWLSGKAFALPKQTTSEGSGYFSIVEGKNGRVYIGTAKYQENAYLVEFSPHDKETARQMRVVLDAQKEIGTNATGFAAQAKLHTRNNVGASGKIYVGTKQGYPLKNEPRLAYPGGYPIVYDPATDKSRVYPIPVPHQGIISITPDESRNIAYISTCSDERPIESTHFMILDLEKGTYRDLMDCRHMYAFIVIDSKGRAYHPIIGGDIARYDPATDKLTRLKQTVDGQPPSEASLLAHPQTHTINWDITPDGKTLYAVAMSGNQLFAYDLTAEGDTLRGKSLGKLLPHAEKTDCRGMCVGPKGDVYAAVLGTPAKGPGYLHLVTYRPGDASPVDLGAVTISNPDFTAFQDAAGKPLPHHHGFKKLPQGPTVPLYHMGVCEARDGHVYMIVIYPYTVIQFAPPRR